MQCSRCKEAFDNLTDQGVCVECYQKIVAVRERVIVMSTHVKGDNDNEVPFAILTINDPFYANMLDRHCAFPAVTLAMKGRGQGNISAPNFMEWFDASVVYPTSEGFHKWMEDNKLKSDDACQFANPDDYDRSDEWISDASFYCIRDEGREWLLLDRGPIPEYEGDTVGTEVDILCMHNDGDIHWSFELKDSDIPGETCRLSLEQIRLIVQHGIIGNRHFGSIPND